MLKHANGNGRQCIRQFDVDKISPPGAPELGQLHNSFFNHETNDLFPIDIQQAVSTASPLHTYRGFLNDTTDSSLDGASCHKPKKNQKKHSLSNLVTFSREITVDP
jgi:hypothetical protein